MHSLFGTDGIRGLAGEPPLDTSTIFAVGRAVGEFLQASSGQPLEFARGRQAPRVLLGEDTRESSPWVTSYLAAGLRAAGVEVVSAGVLPTPAIAELVRARGFAAGAIVSASHNPYRDNGIKLIGASGMKLPDEVEAQLEQRVGQLRPAQEPAPWSPPADLGLAEDYAAHLRRLVGDTDLARLHLVVDCAHGAATRVAPALFRSLGAAVTSINAAPDGRNINAGCGALHPESLRQKVLEVGADLGVAFDGDADRAVFASRAGKIVDGDGVLFVAGCWLKETEKLKPDTVVGTVMTNLGLEVALRRAGLTLVRTAVGDRYVLAEMLRRGANLGGEQSGHIIFLDDVPTGDGILTALKVCSILLASGKTLDQLVADLELFPQALVNVRVRQKIPFEQLPAVKHAIQKATATLGERGRVLVRYSGTEPLARVMVEAETQVEVERWSHEIARALREAIGSN
ncbi:MAG: phosphoglucosamine mutase [Terriglobia bacterium]